jgi:uncharacterized protein (DUF849 family)
MLIKAALNGSRRARKHARVPTASDEIVEAGLAAVRAGAGAVHVHVRDADGKETLAAKDLVRVLTPWRARCPSVSIGVTTGAWIVPDPDERARLVAEWRGAAAPDFASVNIDEPGSLGLAQQLEAQGIAVEAGLANAESAQRWLAHPRPHSALRILLEPDADMLEAALEQTAAMVAILERIPADVPRLLHGQDATAWPLLIEAAERGFDMRIGFEDVLDLPDGTPALSNAQLVETAFELVRTVHARIRNPHEG